MSQSRNHRATSPPADQAAAVEPRSDGFWELTWREWRGGRLAGVSDTFARTATMPLDAFLRCRAASVTHAKVIQHLAAHPPEPGEYLLGHSQQTDGGLDFVLTDRQLWLRDVVDGSFQPFRLDRVRGFRVVQGSRYEIILELADGLAASFKNLSSLPAEALLRWAIDGLGEPAGAALADGASESPPSPEQSSLLPAALPSPAAPPMFEVKVKGEETQEFRDERGLRQAILAGEVPRLSRLNWFVPGAGGKVEKKTYPTVEAFASSHKAFETLYRPVAAYTGKGLLVGLIGGVALKMLDSTIAIASADDPGLLFMWLMTVVALALSAKWPFIAAIVAFHSFRSGLQVNFFLVAISAAAAGAILGAPVGTILGTLTGLVKARRVETAPDAVPEGRRPLVRGLLIPGLALAVIVPLYVMFNLWVLNGGLE